MQVGYWDKETVLGINTQMSPRFGQSIEARYTCKACHRVFVQESKFLAHQCKQMKREEELKSPEGQAAWHFYSLWLRTMKRMPPPAHSFLTSKFFRTFVNFVQFCKRVNLPKPDKFIWLMVQKNFPPTMWMNDDVYVMYIEFIDRKLTPTAQVKISMDTLIGIADKHGIEISEVFTKVKGPEIIQMLRTRQLSPWLLLTSRKFKKLYATEVTADHKIQIDQFIRPEYWGSKFDEYEEDVEKFKELTAEMGI